MSYSDRVKELSEEFATKPMIRSVNYHNVPRSNIALYDKQLANYAQNFTSVNEEEMDEYLVTGRWKKSKPGLIISMNEGHRNGYDVLVPLMEKYGFVGWFWVITSYVNSPVADQLYFADHHRIRMQTHEYSDGRYALSWDELRQLDKKHVVASHARTHTQLTSMSPADQYSEVVGSQEDFKKELGHPVRGFVSLTGPPYGDNDAIDKLINQAQYEYVLSNYLIQRIHPRQTHPRTTHT